MILATLSSLSMLPAFHICLFPSLSYYIRTVSTYPSNLFMSRLICQYSHLSYLLFYLPTRSFVLPTSKSGRKTCPFTRQSYLPTWLAAVFIYLFVQESFLSRNLSLRTHWYFWGDYIYCYVLGGIDWDCLYCFESNLQIRNNSHTQYAF